MRPLAVLAELLVLRILTGSEEGDVVLDMIDCQIRCECELQEHVLLVGLLRVHRPSPA